MTRDQLKKRLIKVKGKPLNKKASSVDANRRAPNYVENTLPPHEDSKFESFFGFEQEIAELESARKQIERIKEREVKEQRRAKELGISLESEKEIEEESYFIIPDDIEENKSGDNSSFFTFEEEKGSRDDSEKAVYTQVKGFEFKYCKFIKANGEQCKRQSPKNGEYCGTHRKMVDKQKDITINK